MRQRRWHRLIGTVLSLALIPTWASVAGASSQAPPRQNCPDQLLGVWRGDLDAKGLLSVRLTITETSPGQYVATVEGSSSPEEALPISLNGGRLRFQSAALPVAFEGERSSDGRTHRVRARARWRTGLPTPP